MCSTPLTWGESATDRKNPALSRGRVGIVEGGRAEAALLAAPKRTARWAREPRGRRSRAGPQRWELGIR